MISVSLLFVATIARTWTVGPNLQLQWNGADYQPVGIQLSPDDKNIKAAKEAGIQDFNLEVPISRNWREASSQVEDKNFFLTVNSSLPNAKGIIIQPQYYRLNNIRKSGTLTLPLPGIDSALVVIAMTRDGSMVSQKTVPVEKGVLNVSYKAATDADQIALIFPMGESFEMEDLWSRLDSRRDQVIRQLKSLKDSKGLRGIINPLGTAPYLANRDSGFVPTDPMFLAEFEDYLEEKYRNLDTLSRSWGLRNLGEAKGFQDISSFVPLWNGPRGVSYFYNWKTKTLVSAENKKSQFWQDVSEAISRTRVRRIHRIIRSIKKEAGVPVFQEWLGWSWFLENPMGELTGVVAKVGQNTPSGILNSVAGAMSSNLRASNPGPIFATDVVYSPDLSKPDVLEDFSKVGIRGIFIRTNEVKDFAGIAAIKLGTPTERPRGTYYPQNASDPAFTLRLSDGSWWLPSPTDGNRINLGTDVSAYQTSDGKNTTYAIWKNGPASVVEFRLLNATNAKFRTTSSIVSKIDLTKTGFRVMLDSSPLIISDADHVPVPESELSRLEREITKMVEYTKSKRQDLSMDVYELRDFKDLVDTAPHKALANAQKVHDRLSLAVSNSIWAECESSSDNTFSEVVKDAGCSNGSYLSVRTPFADISGPLYANVVVPQRTNQQMEIWISAKIPNSADKERIKVKIGGQVLSLQGAGVNPYGSGFAWYKLGTTRLPAVRSEVKIEVNGVSSTNVGFDSIVLAAQSFVPRSILIPEFLIPEPVKPDKGGGLPF